jgi:hypothetical protein
VYRTDVHPFAFLPHSIKWQVLSFLFAVVGAAIFSTSQSVWAAILLLVPGIVGIVVTLAKNVAYALRSEVDSLPGVEAHTQPGPIGRAFNRAWYRGMVLPALPPAVARLRGRIRGTLSPLGTRQPTVEAQTSRGPRPSLGAWRAPLLITGNDEDRRARRARRRAHLSQLTDWFPICAVGPSRRRRLVGRLRCCVFMGRWAWARRALAEDHGADAPVARQHTCGRRRCV